jgi:hypothetical protein
VLQKCGAYLPSFQISVASFQSFPTFSQTTTYFPVTSFGVGALVFKLKVPISRRPGCYVPQPLLQIPVVRIEHSMYP